MIEQESRPQPDVEIESIPPQVNRKRRKKHRIARGIISGMLFTTPVVSSAIVYEAQQLTGGSFISAVPEIINGPSDKGEITLDPDKKYNFLAIGDSLARGVGGEKTLVEGKEIPSSWVAEIVELANKKSPDIASQLFIPRLAVSGSSAEHLNERLNSHSEQLVGIPNLVLCMSAEYKNLNQLLIDIRDRDNPSIFTTKDLLKHHLDAYSDDLRNIEATLNSVRDARKENLEEESSLKVIALGLPNLQEIPQVKKLIDGGKIKSWQVRLLTNLFNTRLAEAGFVFADIADVPFGSQLISKDGLHPTQEGYDKIAQDVSNSSVRIALGKGTS